MGPAAQGIERSRKILLLARGVLNSAHQQPAGRLHRLCIGASEAWIPDDLRFVSLRSGTGMTHFV
jgi:hypothetical protein